MIDKQGYKVIDADAHVVETKDSWSYLEGSDKKFRPQLFQADENPNTKIWILDGKPEISAVTEIATLVVVLEAQPGWGAGTLLTSWTDSFYKSNGQPIPYNVDLLEHPSNKRRSSKPAVSFGQFG